MGAAARASSKPDLRLAFKESRAPVIANSAYANGWIRLPGARADGDAVAAALRRNGFVVDVAYDLTRARIDSVLSHFMRQHGSPANKDNRLLIYFVGHGYTLKPTYGSDPVGYLVGVDAALPERDLAGFLSGAVDIRELELYSRQIQAKHVLFMFDACFAGTVFGVARGGDAFNINYKLNKPVRQFITSGSADEEVPDVSEFRRAFVRLLDGEQRFDPNNDGFLTGTELGLFLEHERIRGNIPSTES